MSEFTSEEGSDENVESPSIAGDELLLRSSTRAVGSKDWGSILHLVHNVYKRIFNGVWFIWTGVWGGDHSVLRYEYPCTHGWNTDNQFNDSTYSQTPL